MAMFNSKLLVYQRVTRLVSTTVDLEPEHAIYPGSKNQGKKNISFAGYVIL